MSQAYLRHAEAYEYLDQAKGPNRQLLSSINGVLVMYAYPETFPDYKNEAKPENIDLFFFFKHAVKTLSIFMDYNGGPIKWGAELDHASFANIGEARSFIASFPHSNCRAFLMMFDSLIPGASPTPGMSLNLYWVYRALGNALYNDIQLDVILKTEKSYDGNEQVDWA